MPYRRQFYDPIIQTDVPPPVMVPEQALGEDPPAPEPEPEPSHVTDEPDVLSGIQVTKTGVYLHLDDVVTYLRFLGLHHAADIFQQYNLR